jgi:hypothetical protein
MPLRTLFVKLVFALCLVLQISGWAQASSDISSWKRILASSKNISVSSYGRDSNYALLESALSDMSVRAGNLSTIIYPGGGVLATRVDKLDLKDIA